MPETDIVLVQRFAREGDAEAFAEIVRRYAGLVYSVCHRILGDRDRAKDASQDTFFRLLQNPESITKSVAGWLHKVATQRAIDVVRRDSSRQKRETHYVSTMSIKASKWEDISPHIDEALTELQEDSRILLVQHFLMGKTQKELATEFEMSQPTISRKIKTELKELREKLQKKGIIVGTAVLGILLLKGISEAAPSILLNELGKMAMLSGVKTSTITGTSVTSESVTGATFGILKKSLIVSAFLGIIAAISIILYFNLIRPKLLTSRTEKINTEYKEAMKEKKRFETTEIDEIKVEAFVTPPSPQEVKLTEMRVEKRQMMQVRKVNCLDSYPGYPASSSVEIEITGALAIRTLTILGKSFRPYQKWPPPPQWTLGCGHMTVRVNVNPNGKIEEKITVIKSSGYPDWDDAIIDWLKGWEWQKFRSVTEGIINLRFPLWEVLSDS